MNNYDLEAKARWGETQAYKEYQQKTVNQSTNDGLMSVIAEFGLCMQSGNSPASSEAQELVKELQTYITDNYYTCTNEILSGLGQMYVCDERFKTNIDKTGNGTAEFICESINIFCKK